MNVGSFLMGEYGVNVPIFSSLNSHVWRIRICSGIFGCGVQVLSIWRHLSGRHANGVKLSMKDRLLGWSRQSHDVSDR